ncbi:hypothetical protein ABZ897_43090 [Nonomuraea sp. NPDC046802]|uniref:hypothetical protein n=1 Tax=Nonomuraea sp. NPDC046802 TaxID=3154919 RepID=UPI0033F14416
MGRPHLAQQVAQACREENEARDHVVVTNSRIEVAERERDNALAAQRATKQHAEHLRTTLTALLQRLPALTSEPGTPPKPGPAADDRG